MDAIELLEQDHREVEDLFGAFEGAGKGAYRDKRAIVDQLIEELSKHAAIEEGVLYPAARKALKSAREEDDIVLESLEEHHVVKWILHELETLKPDHERFDAKVNVRMENVRQHVHEEEEHLFPMLREAMNAKQLDGLGAQLEKAKKVAPLRPHPRNPDSPPANLFTTPIAAIADRGARAAKRAPAQGARKVSQALAARTAREKAPGKNLGPAPARATKSSTRRKTSKRASRRSK